MKNTRPALLSLLALPLLALALSAQTADFGGLNESTSRPPTVRLAERSTSSAPADLELQRRKRLTAAQQISTAIENPNDAAAVAALQNALKELLALIRRLEEDLGLSGKGSGQPFYAYPLGLEKGALLNQAYQTAGQAYENLYRRSAKSAKPTGSFATEAIKFYWQAAATGYFQLQQGNWEKKIFADLARDPAISRLSNQGKSAASLLNSFMVYLTGNEFSEARSDALRSRRGILNALKEQADNGFADLDKTPLSLPTEFGERMASRNPDKVPFMDKQAAAEAVAEAYFRMGQEYLSASQTAQKDDDLLLALKHFQMASAQIYWSRSKKFRLNQAQVQTLAKSLLARLAGDTGLAAGLAAQIGLPAEQVQAALDRFAEELVKFVQVPGTLPTAASSGETSTPAKTLRRIDPADLDALLTAAQRNDQASFERVVRKLGFIPKGRADGPPADQDQRVAELLAKLKELLNRDTVPYGYWLAVTGTPERAREAYFSIVKKRFKLDVSPMASTLAAENFIKGLRKQENLAGMSPEKAAGAQGDYVDLARLEKEAMSAIVRGDKAKAEQAFTRAEAILDRMTLQESGYFKSSEAIKYKTSFSQLRSKLYLERGDLAMDASRQLDRGTPAHQAALLKAMQAYFAASDEYPLRRAELQRAAYYRRKSGDERLPGLLVDSMETAGKHKIHTNPHAIYASKKLNAMLEELMLGNDPEFLRVVEDIARELLAVRAATHVSESSDASVDLSEEFKNKVSKVFGDRGLILYDPQLSEVAREILELLYTREVDEGQRRIKLKAVVARVARTGTINVTEEVARSMEEQANSVLATSDAVDSRDRDDKTHMESVVKQWDGRLSKATPSAQALNEIFFSIATKFRNRAQLAESQAEVLEKKPDVEAAKQKRNEANENYLNAMRFYFMASKRVFYGNEQTLAIQLPEWDVSLFLAYRAWRLATAEAPALLKVTGDWASTLFKTPAGSRLVFVGQGLRQQGSLMIQGARALLQEGARAPVQLAMKGLAAAGRGIFGHARTPAGKLVSLGGLAFFIWMNYAHNVTLEENRLIELQDTSRAEEAQSAFWDVVRSRAIPKPLPAASTATTTAP